ncbi:MAG TPA: hypothetical protein VMU04_15745 [Candidatus Acidoferrum sp.]|nr:hypothetical protein [Candidatus Acidoferrum sp.]
MVTGNHSGGRRRAWSSRAARVKLVLAAALAGTATLGVLSARQPNIPMSQQNAQLNVQSQVSWFQNSTRTASNYGGGGGDGYGLVFQQFQTLQGTYNAFKASLSPQQIAAGANELAELDAGLGILSEAFGNFQQEVAEGQSSTSAFNEMCQVLYQASGVWLQEFNSVCSRLRVGWQ